MEISHPHAGEMHFSCGVLHAAHCTRNALAQSDPIQTGRSTRKYFCTAPPPLRCTLFSTPQISALSKLRREAMWIQRAELKLGDYFVNPESDHPGASSRTKWRSPPVLLRLFLRSPLANNTIPF
jgi:hypothetical protein